METLQKIKIILIEIVKSIWDFLKKMWNFLRYNPEAVLVLILAGIGLTYLIGELTTKMECPEWMEETMIAPVISSLCMMAIIALMQRRAKCQNQ